MYKSDKVTEIAEVTLFSGMSHSERAIERQNWKRFHFVYLHPYSFCSLKKRKEIPMNFNEAPTRGAPLR
jgi:hypothetical protein